MADEADIPADPASSPTESTSVDTPVQAEEAAPTESVVGVVVPDTEGGEQIFEHTVATEQSTSQTSASASPSIHDPKADSARGLAKRRAKTGEYLEKIVAHAREKKEITNDDVEKLLHVADATASRYLKMLVERGKLIRAGKGRSVKYRVA